MTYKLAIHTIPRPLWDVNLRARLTDRGWKKLRDPLIAELGLTCPICGKVETKSSAISAHEEWQYDTSRSPAERDDNRLLLDRQHG